MVITFNFLFLFTLIVIPGLLFKRFYFYGEFSKQFNSKEKVYKSIFYSIIPGVIIQSSVYFLFLFIFKSDIQLSTLLVVSKELFANNNEYSIPTCEFLESGYIRVLYYLLFVFSIAIFTGWFLSRLVRWFKFDIRFKNLRYKNSWYYTFSGEIRTFKKFLNASQKLNDDDEKLKSYEYYPPYADILVSENGGSNLYSGYIIDYELDFEDLNSINRLYLAKASRYRPKREGEDLTNLDVKGSRIKVPISGNIFVLNGANIQNINLTFKRYKKILPSVENKSQKRLRILSLTLNSLSIFTFILITVSRITPLREIIYKNFALDRQFEFPIWFFITLTLVQFISLFIPIREIESKGSDRLIYRYKLKSFFGKLLVLILLVLADLVFLYFN